METFLIKHFIKNNFEKMTEGKTIHMSKSTSKKLNSKSSLIQLSSKNINSK